MKTSTLTLALALALATVLQAQISIEQAQVSIEEVADEVLERDPEVVHSFKGDYEWGSCNGSTLFGIPMRHTTYSHGDLLRPVEPQIPVKYEENLELYGIAGKKVYETKVWSMNDYHPYAHWEGAVAVLKYEPPAHKVDYKEKNRFGNLAEKTREVENRTYLLIVPANQVCA